MLSIFIRNTWYYKNNYKKLDVQIPIICTLLTVALNNFFAEPNPLKLYDKHIIRICLINSSIYQIVVKYLNDLPSTCVSTYNNIHILTCNEVIQKFQNRRLYENIQVLYMQTAIPRTEYQITKNTKIKLECTQTANEEIQPFAFSTGNCTHKFCFIGYWPVQKDYWRADGDEYIEDTFCRTNGGAITNLLIIICPIHFTVIFISSFIFIFLQIDVVHNYYPSYFHGKLRTWLAFSVQKVLRLPEVA